VRATDEDGYAVFRWKHECRLGKRRRARVLMWLRDGVDLDDLTVEADHTSKGKEGWCRSKGKVKPRKKGEHSGKHGKEGGDKKAANAKEAEEKAADLKKTLLQNLHGGAPQA